MKINVNKTKLQRAMYVAVVVLLIGAIAALAAINIVSRSSALLPAAPVPGAPPAGVTDGEGTPMVPEVVYDMPKEIIFSDASAAADNSITVRAIFEPANATNQNVIWSMFFAFPEGVNEMTKSEYSRAHTPEEFITLTTDGTTATITQAKKEWQYPIGLKVQSVRNPELTAQCNIHYMRRQTMRNVKLISGSTEINLPNSSRNAILLDKTVKEFTIEPEIEYGFGTIYPARTLITGYTLTLSPMFICVYQKCAELDPKIKIDQFKLSAFRLDIPADGVLSLSENTVIEALGDIIYEGYTNSFFKELSDPNTRPQDVLEKRFTKEQVRLINDAMQSLDPVDTLMFAASFFMFKLNVNTEQDGEISTKSFRFATYSPDIEIPVTGIKLSDSSLIF